MQQAYTYITTEELNKKRHLPSVKILDIRPIAAFNGWKLKNEGRGGHIPGAKNIPHQWTQFIDWVEVLEEKEIHRSDTLIIYGYETEEMEKMAETLRELNYKDIFLFTDFIDSWSTNPQFPMEHLARYTHLVYPDWVNKLIQGKNPAHYKGNKYVICHAHYDNYGDYLEGHIPGAISLNTNSLESPNSWNRRTPEELKRNLEELGISHDTTVIVYGRYSTPDFNTQDFPGQSAGHLGAIRSAAIMLYAGVKDVKILNGGLTTWELEGFKLSQMEVPPTPIADFGIDIPAKPEIFIDSPEAKEYIASKDADLISIRSWREFIGEYSGYHYIKQKGRIPGAIFGNCGSDAYHMENYRNLDHTMRQADEVADTWIQGGISPDKRLAFYCGTGWRGSEAFFNAYLMGWPRVAIYDGGWYEWSSDPQNPVETGIPPA